MKKIIYGFLTFFFLCLFVIIAIEIRYADEKQEFIPTTFRVNYAYPCQFENGHWVQTDVFKSNNKVHICVNITTNKPSIEHNIQIYVFKDEVNPEKEGIFYDYRSFTIEEENIPINYEFSPGKYYIAAYYVRDTLFELPIEVVK